MHLTMISRPYSDLTTACLFHLILVLFKFIHLSGEVHYITAPMLSRHRDATPLWCSLL